MTKYLLFLIFFGDCPATNSSLQRIINKELSSEDFYVRESASRKLYEHGFFALPALQKNFNHKDLEVAWRCQEAHRRYMNVSYKGDRPHLWTCLDSQTSNRYYALVQKNHLGEHLIFPLDSEAMDAFLNDILSEGTPKIIIQYWMKVMLNRTSDNRWSGHGIGMPSLKFDPHFLEVQDGASKETIKAMQIIVWIREYRKLARKAFLHE